MARPRIDGDRAELKLTQEENAFLRRVGENSTSKGVKRLVEIFRQLEAIAELANVPINYLLAIAPHAIKAHAFNFEGVRFEGLFIFYLSSRAAQGDTEAKQLLEMALLKSSAIAIEELKKEGKIGNSCIV